MLQYSAWKDEKETIQLLTQILGKYCLEDRKQRPQWAHIMLDITPQGLSTGTLFHARKTYSLNLNFIDHIIEIKTVDGEKSISLKNGTTIKEYYFAIVNALANFGITTEISKNPQEMQTKTPFDEDEEHKYYKPEIMKEFLDILHFVYHVETRFVHSLRGRNVLPGFFFGTFDLSTIVNKNNMYRTFGESRTIEYNAFDEEIIEFGFWFGDDKYKGPTFFILPYPFIDEKFEYSGEGFPEEVVHDKKLSELIFEIDDLSPKTEEKVLKFFEQGHKLFDEYMGWNEYEYATTSLTMPTNAFEKY